DDTLYSGEPGQRDLPLDISKDYDEIVRMVAEGKYVEAEERMRQRWLGRPQNCYQPLGDLWIETSDTGSPGAYRRELDIDTAVASAQFPAAGAIHRREYFCSHPARCLVVRLRGLNPGQLLRVRITSPHPAELVHQKPGAMRLEGQAPGFVLRRTLRQVEQSGETWKYPELWTSDGHRKPQAGQILYGERAGGLGMRFVTALEVEAPGSHVEADSQGVRITAGGDILLLITSGTSFNGPTRSPSKQGKDERAEAEQHLALARAKGFDALLAEHIRDYQQLFRRVSLNLGALAANAALPTDERLLRNQKEPDSALAALYFQFGRYLMISGSRPGSQPLNLQGIWNEHVIPPWGGAYTININTEMNYWPAEVTNLSECTEPLLRMVEELAVDGGQVARQMYQRPGWVAHHNTTIWRGAQPVDGGTRASFWPMAAGWLTAHLWEHYLFTGDLDFLRNRAYPLLRGAAEFFLAWLRPDAQGRLQTPVGTSPENAFLAGEGANRKAASVSISPTCDIATIRETFLAVHHAAKTLGLGGPIETQVAEALPKLPPYRIGSEGQLLEWSQDFAEAEPQHRHVSHLYGLHPGAHIGRAGTPREFDGVKRSLERRGDGGTGWAMAWKVNLWARLGDGNRAWRLYQNLIQPARLPGSDRLGGGAMPNLMCAHPPFQIDGNFGGAAGLAEMLVQSHEGDIHLLPALPDAWPEGSVDGLRARGALGVSLSWAGGRLRSALLLAAESRAVRVRYRGKVWEGPLPAAKPVDVAPYVT
ncbi:MAG: glycoside hydrolase N-terminal domain-containing protein, partial [Bryobacterales bacterium]|nr:glycoside hydrolase N-terminal domain-containing protein [Bryobacterales bacterium]